MTKHTKGVLLAVSGAAFWGTSGVAVQDLFATTTVNILWLVGLRLLCAGLLLVGYSLWTTPAATRRLFADWRLVGWLLGFAVLGVGSSQLAYFSAVRYSNAPTATVIQYLAPVFIVGYLAIRHRTLPRRIDVLSILVALLGTLILVTHGHLDQLALSPLACLWGLLAAVTEAINTVMPRRLFQRCGTITVIGWSMLLCGLGFLPVYAWIPAPALTAGDWALIAYIIISGTLLAYILYLASVTYISASTTGMLEAFEPLVATTLAILLLHTPFGPLDLTGGVLIILATFLQMLPQSPLVLRKRTPQKPPTVKP